MTKVLVIEDNNDIRENYAEILQLAGYHVDEASNGKIGVEMAFKNPPDLILCDIMMDELDGYGVLHMLSKNTQTSNIPFIFITAKAERKEQRKGMEMGADDYLIKPFDDIELLTAVECRLRKKEQQQNFYSKPMQELGQLVAKNEGMPVLRKIIDDHKYRFFKKKQIVHYEGERVAGIYLIISGKIKTVKMAEDGRELTTGIYEKDDFIGTNIMLSNKVYSDMAIAIEDSTLCFFPLQQFEELISRYPDVAGKFIKIMSNQIREKEELLLQMAYNSVRKRIAETLLRYAGQHCKNSEPINLSRIDLAGLSGTATETVSRTLTEFKNEGLLDKKSNEIIILDYNKLSRLKN